MGTDEEVGEDPFPRAAGAPVAQPTHPGLVGHGVVDRSNRDDEFSEGAVEGGWMAEYGYESVYTTLEMRIAPRS